MIFKKKKNKAILLPESMSFLKELYSTEIDTTVFINEAKEHTNKEAKNVVKELGKRGMQSYIIEL